MAICAIISTIICLFFVSFFKTSINITITVESIFLKYRLWVQRLAFSSKSEVDRGLQSGQTKD